MPRNIYIYIWI